MTEWSNACTLANLLGEHSPPRYSAIRWGDFRFRRQQGDYADYGHEVQIADFRLT